MVASRTVLAFDYGQRRIGVAVGQEVSGTAQALATIAVRDSQLTPAIIRAKYNLEQLAMQESQLAQANKADAEAAYKSGRTFVIIVLVVGLVIGVALGLYIARGIVNRVGVVSRVIDRIAEGDLTTNVGTTSRDEIGRMGQQLDREYHFQAPHHIPQ